MGLTDKTSKRTAIFLGVALLIIIIIIAMVISGAGGVVAVLKFILITLFICGFFAFLFYIVYFLFFKKHRIDVTYENWKNYLVSAKDNGADMMKDLVLIGDKNHSSKKFMTITGYLRIKSFDNDEYDMFVGKKQTWNMMEEDKIVMVAPDKHSDLIGDVYIYGISLIKIYGFYHLNSEMMNFKAIDKFVSQDAFRTVFYYLLGDMKGLVDRSTGLDPDYSKQRQQEKLLKIPILQGQDTQK